MMRAGILAVALLMAACGGWQDTGGMDEGSGMMSDSAQMGEMATDSGEMGGMMDESGMDQSGMEMQADSGMGMAQDTSGMGMN
jgi:hypothetical protein